MLAYGLLLVTRCWLISVPRSSVAHLYPLLADQLSLLCSLLATRLMVLLASRSSTYAAPGIVLLIACYTSTFLPVVLAEYYLVAVRCTMFALRFSLYKQLKTCYSLLPLCCLLADYCLALASRLLDPFFFVAGSLPFTARLLNAYYMPIAITCWQLTTHRSLFSVFNSLLTDRRALLVVSS